MVDLRWLLIAAAALAGTSLAALLTAGIALARRRALGGLLALGLALCLLATAGLAGGLAAGLHGYAALTHEELAAVVMTRPTGPQRFEAVFQFPDGRRERFSLAGDALYVDARILKWKGFATLLGLHTVYKLDRVAGRYRELRDERTKPRTVYSLAEGGPLDLFSLRRRYTLLAPLVDATYGSATFAPTGRPARFELCVSTTGLLLRARPLSRASTALGHIGASACAGDERASADVAPERRRRPPARRIAGGTRSATAEST